MQIESINITSFGGLRGLSLELSDGVTVIEGANESGKSTVAAFIKFMLYGFADKSERATLSPWDGGAAEGSMVVRCADARYRIGRRYRDGRDDCQIIELLGNTQCHKGRQPGEVFLGVGAEVFEHTAFVSQLEGGRVNGEEVSAAIGNMLFSADETLNVQRAQKRLEDERVGLWHKNRRGGRIFELEAERENLLERRRSASADGAAIISKEGLLADLKAKIRENSQRLEKLSKIMAAHDFGQRAKKRAAIEELRGRLANLEKERAAITERYSCDGFLPDEKFVSKLDELRRALEYLGKRAAEIDTELGSAELGSAELGSAELGSAKIGFAGNGSAKSSAPPEGPPEKVKLLRKHGGREALLDKYEGPRLRRRAMVAFGIIFGILFVPAAVIAVSIMLINLTYGVVASLGALALLFGMVMCFISSVKYTRAVDDLLDEFGAANNNEFMRIVDEAASYVEPAREDGGRMLREGERARLDAQRKAKRSELEALLSRWGGRSLESALADLAEYNAKLSVNTAETEKTTAELTGAETQRAESDDGRDDAALRALAERLPDDLNIAAIRREHDFLTKANASMAAKTHELELELAQLNAKTDSPAQLADQITRLESELAKLRGRYAAVELAIETLGSAAENMRDSVSPRLSEYAGRMMEVFSGGRYSSVAVAADLSMSYDAGTGAVTRHGMEFMSAGTLDIAYLSLRLALINLMYRREPSPLVFDESFTRLDDGRLRNVLRLLAQAANSGAQVIIFTAQTREYAIMSHAVRHIRL